MAETKKKKVKLPTLVTPKGVNSFSYIHAPDTEGKYANGKYKVRFGMDKGLPEVEALVSKLNAMHEQAKGKKKTESPVKDGDELYEEADDDKKEFREWMQGKYVLNFSSQFPPQLLNRDGEELGEKIQIRAGDIIKVGFAAAPYEAGKNAGISLQLRAVKLLKKRAFTGQDYSDAFGDEEPDDDDDDTSDDTSTDDTSSNDGSGGDF